MRFSIRHTSFVTTVRNACAGCTCALLTLFVTLPVHAQATGTTPVAEAATQSSEGNANTAKVGWIEGILRKEMKAGGFAWGSPAHMRIYKEENILEMWLKKGARYEKFKDFRICKWSGKIGPKLQEGDEQSPEGVYSVARDQLLSRTKNHRAVNLNFPNAYDQRVNRTGSYLQIHGGCGSVGCYAMTDRGIEEIYRILDASFEAGQERVSTHIFPFRMTDEKLAARKKHAAFGFWSMLKPIYTSFQSSQTLPGVRVCGTRYVAPGEAAKPPEQCVPVWQVPKATRVAKRSTKASAGASTVKREPAPPPIVVKCNLKLPTCKRWLAIRRRKLAAQGVRTRGVRQSGASYVRRASAGAVARTGTTRVVRNRARERRRRALRQ